MLIKMAISNVSKMSENAVLQNQRRRLGGGHLLMVMTSVRMLLSQGWTS